MKLNIIGKTRLRSMTCKEHLGQREIEVARNKVLTIIQTLNTTRFAEENLKMRNLESFKIKLKKLEKFHCRG